MKKVHQQVNSSSRLSTERLQVDFSAVSVQCILFSELFEYYLYLSPFLKGLNIIDF